MSITFNPNKLDAIDLTQYVLKLRQMNNILGKLSNYVNINVQSFSVDQNNNHVMYEFPDIPTFDDQTGVRIKRLPFTMYIEKTQFGNFRISILNRYGSSDINTAKDVAIEMLLCYTCGGKFKQLIEYPDDNICDLFNHYKLLKRSELSDMSVKYHF